MAKRVCLFLDDDSIDSLDDLRSELILSKSKIVRKLLHFFGREENRVLLKRIVREEY